MTNHYADGSDNPAWATNATSSGVTTTAYTPGIGASMAAEVTTPVGGTAQANLELADLAGNIVTNVPVPASGDAQQDQGIGSYTSLDEYGNIETAADTSPTLPDTGVDQYGYLGMSQRAQAGAGLTLMGARLYNPTTGRFTSTDPVIGGNENAYNYPDDPVNSQDASGQYRTQYWPMRLGHTQIMIAWDYWSETHTLTGYNANGSKSNGHVSEWTSLWRRDDSGRFPSVAAFLRSVVRTALMHYSSMSYSASTGTYTLQYQLKLWSYQWIWFTPTSYLVGAWTIIVVVSANYSRVVTAYVKGGTRAVRAGMR